MKPSRILVTSALPYINGVKHLGNLVGSMLPADIYARFQRQQIGNDRVLFICATDEHGTPAELAALAEGVDVRSYCDFWHGEQRRLAIAFGLSFDHFGRSSSPHNSALTQEFAKTLWEAGYLEERVTKQAFSSSDGRFLPDRYVIGTCPHCGYDKARGDQCENCTRVLDTSDLINPRSAVSGAQDIEIRDTKHLFLRQSTFSDQIRSWIDGKHESWPVLATSIALKWLDEGLADRGITRDLSWGIPVNAATWGANPSAHRPDAPAYDGKVFYVWFDAPIEYIAATWEWADVKDTSERAESTEPSAWHAWWKGKSAADVTYVQFMGKDNVPFHTVGFPATIMGVNAGEPADGRWKLVDELKALNWLDYYGTKFSTSQGIGVFMDAALELLPADYWRWYLFANMPENSDSTFTWESFQSIVNKDLCDVFGNYINRVLRLVQTRFDGVVPNTGPWGDEEVTLARQLANRSRSFTESMEARQFRRAYAELRGIWVSGNEYITAAAPWVTIKTDPVAAARSIAIGVNLARLFALWSAAIVPSTAERVLGMLGVRSEVLKWPSGDIETELNAIRGGHHIGEIVLLFSKVTDDQIATWRERFGAPSH